MSGTYSFLPKTYLFVI